MLLRRKFTSVGRRGLVPLFVLLLGAVFILYGTGCQQNQGGQVSPEEKQGSGSGTQDDRQVSQERNQGSGSSTPKKSVSTGPKTNEVNPATFLGRPTTDPEIQEYVIQNGCESTGMGRRCSRSGVEFSYDTGGRVSGMFYYVAGNNLFQPYKGPLPGNLSARDTKADVDQKLGPPQQTHLDWASYPPQVPGTASLGIEFAPRGAPIKPNSSIDRIRFSKKR